MTPPGKHGSAVESGGDRGQLRVAKLRAIGEQHLGLTQGELDGSHAFADGAGMISGDRAAVLVGRPSRRSLGPALSWAATRTVEEDGERSGLARLDLVLDPSVPVDAPAAGGGGLDADDDPRAIGGQLARIGVLFRPEVRVWLVAGAEVTELDSAARPVPAPPPWAESAELVGLLVDVGLDVVGEPGMILGEVAGLEVARVTVEHGQPCLAIGVGRFDQELAAVAQADLPRRDALVRAADLVRLSRTLGHPSHPMSRLARERWLRAELIADPAAVDAAHLSAVPALWVRRGLRHRMPAVAVGESAAGDPLVAVSSVGIDLDLVPFALDAAEAADPAARVVLALPAADVVAATERVAALANARVDLVPVRPPWGPEAAAR